MARPWHRLLVLVFLAPPAGPPAQAPPATAPARQEYRATLAGFPDASVFFLFVKETPIGTIRCDRQATGEVTAAVEVAMAGQTVTAKIAILPDEKGAWRRIELAAAAGEARIEREGLLVTREIQGQRSTLTIPPAALLYNNNLPGLLADAVRLCEAAPGKEAKVAMVAPESGVFAAAISFRGEEERAVGGRDQRFRTYRLGLPGVDTALWADAAGRIVLFDIPMQKACFVRQGYEPLARKEAGDPLLSRPRFAVRIEPDSMVPMRDGVRLATDLYLPETGEKAPLVLLRTPYGKRMLELEGRYWARRGYACAIQECRGRFRSEGVWTPFLHEAQDGYDTIEALAVRPWCTGRVGMIGASYGGWVQWWALSLKPPHLTTIIPNVAPPDPQFNIPFEYGTFFLLGAIWWAKVLETGATADLTGKAMQAVNEADYSRLLRTLPVIDLDTAFLGGRNPFWRGWIERREDEAFWRPARFLDRLAGADIPVFHQSGWFDGDGIGAKLNYLAMKAAGHRHQRLVLGPWGHTDTATRIHGDRDFTNEAAVDLAREYTRWFDCWLKGIDNGVRREPMVRLFVMGENRWRTGESYPLEGTVFRKLFLASGKGANSGQGDGRLVWAPEADSARADTFVYDPADPTPDPEFYPTQSREERAQATVSAEAEAAAERSYHRRVADARRDLLVYRTEPLKEPLTLCGPLAAVLHAATSARDTDWFVSLSEEDRDGRILTLGTGKVRARYRRSAFKPELLEPGQAYEYDLDLWHTGITLPAGSRLRVEVASARFPTFSRNLNTGGHNELEKEFVKAEQRVFLGGDRPSHILLPVLPAAAR